MRENGAAESNYMQGVCGGEGAVKSNHMLEDREEEGATRSSYVREACEGEGAAESNYMRGAREEKGAAKSDYMQEACEEEGAAKSNHMLGTVKKRALPEAAMCGEPVKGRALSCWMRLYTKGLRMGTLHKSSHVREDREKRMLARTAV